ncbi:MAG: hybrid sensor histidine kinase/response regulator [Methylococcaceae bacterium]|nr:hybrid sensor histidine kinase/response regulator [Methylococcaceae bacterium]
MSAPDAFLMELFREEMGAHSAVLTDGLLTLERDGGSRERIEPLMRAAHSIKGAARVVDLLPAVHIAHEMEDVLVAAGEGRVKLDAAMVDILLAALDWMVGMSAVADEALADWMEQHAAEAEEWVARVGVCLGKTPQNPVAEPGSEEKPELVSAPLPADADPVLASTPVAASVSVADPVVEASPDPAPSVPSADESSAPAAKAAQASAKKASPPANEPAESTDAPVRITAETLSQMLAFAADMLLEARRIEGLARDLQSLKRLQRRLLATVQSCGGDPESSQAQVREGLAELGSAVDHHDGQLADVASRTNFLSERLHNLALRGRMRPFSDGVQGFPRLVRDVARQLGKQVDFEILGQSTLVDRDILSRLDAPLNHLLRNALDHGLETPEARLAHGKPATGKLRLEARHRSGRLLVSISDDGHGIDADSLRAKIINKGLITAEMAERLTTSELYDFLFLPGLSTRDTVSEISGRGVGLDVVQTMVHACGGSLQVSSERGAGTRFELQLPVTRSVIRTLRVEVAGQGYALPLARIDRAERRDATQLESLNGNYYFATEQGNVALISARRLLGIEDAPMPAAQLSLVLISSEGRQYALEVDALHGECDLVVRPLDRRLGKVPNLSSVALDEHGQPVLIMDVDDLVRSSDRLSGQSQPTRRRPVHAVKRRTRRILVVDDSITVREVERKLLENGGYDVDVAVDGMDGWNQLTLNAYDLVVTDVDMPRMNGIELVTRIKADPKLSGLPVIIVSYKDREEDRLRGMQAGADYYLTKSSFHDRGLIQAVRDLIGGADDV